MPKGMKGYEDQPDGGYTKYPAEGAKVVKNGGNEAKHVGIVSAGQKYPTPDKGASNMSKGMTG